jgi:hypothetical protein
MGQTSAKAREERARKRDEEAACCLAALACLVLWPLFLSACDHADEKRPPITAAAPVRAYHTAVNPNENA